VALGVIAGISAFLIATSLFAWMSPTILGLVLAIQMSWASGQKSIGLWLKARGLLTTPEETTPPPIATNANAITEDYAARDLDECDAIALLHTDAVMRERHVGMLPKADKRERGQFSAERALAEAKLGEADSLEEASKWLRGKERGVVLADRALIAMLARLPATLPATLPTTLLTTLPATLPAPSKA
jgi:membrane glycosyltransferase